MDEEREFMADKNLRIHLNKAATERAKLIPGLVKRAKGELKNPAQA